VITTIPSTNHLSIFGHRISWTFIKLASSDISFVDIIYLVLDPRISYAGLKEDFKDDLDLSVHLETAKEDLAIYFKENYLSSQASEPHPIPLSSTASISSIASTASRATTATLPSPQKNFTARFQRKRAARDELLEFWNLQQEEFEICDPLQWWLGRKAQFPNLYCLSCDIFSIPGTFYFIYINSVLQLTMYWYYRISSCR
jgi:hypothetical protein